MGRLVLPIAIGMLITGALNTITMKYQVSSTSDTALLSLWQLHCADASTCIAAFSESCPRLHAAS